MEYWTLLSFIIQMLLGMGLASDHDRESSGDEVLRLKYSIDIRTPESVIGATFYNENILLVYSLNVLAIVDVANKTQTVYKYVTNFHPRKLMSGFSENELLLLSPGWHCIRQLNFTASEVDTFSGDCLLPGFVDGEGEKARYNLPSDMERSGDYFFIADYNNDCIRRLWNDGYVKTFISIHSKPFELTSNLYVAAHHYIYKIWESRNTYARFVQDVNATILESCTSDMISMLSANKCLKLLPISRDISVHPATINNSFDGLICHQNVPIVTKFIYTNSNRTTMQLYAVDDQAATGIIRTTTTLQPTAIQTTTPTTAAATFTTKKSITTLIGQTLNTRSTTAERTTPNTTIANSTTQKIPDKLLTANSTLHQNYSDVTESILSSDSFNSTVKYIPRGPPAPLHNHAHDQFSHLPSSYTEENDSWSVILPVVLAIATVLAILIALAIILYKRSPKHQLDVNAEDLASDDDDDDDAEDTNSPEYSTSNTTPSQCLLQSTSLNGCQLYNDRLSKRSSKSNGYAKVSVPLSNGIKLPRLSNGNGVVLSDRRANGDLLDNGNTTAL